MRSALPMLASRPVDWPLRYNNHPVGSSDVIQQRFFLKSQSRQKSPEYRLPSTLRKRNQTDVRKGVPGILYKNDVPLSVNEAFKKNRERTEQLSIDPQSLNLSGFPGYRAEGLLTNRKPLKIPDKNSSNNPTGKKAYFALGDNSTDSLDGRMWGFVPENEIIPVELKAGQMSLHHPRIVHGSGINKSNDRRIYWRKRNSSCNYGK